MAGGEERGGGAVVNASRKQLPHSLEGIISSNILTATNPYRVAIAACSC